MYIVLFWMKFVAYIIPGRALVKPVYQIYSKNFYDLDSDTITT